MYRMVCHVGVLRDFCTSCVEVFETSNIKNVKSTATEQDKYYFIFEMHSRPFEKVQAVLGINKKL